MRLFDITIGKMFNAYSITTALCLRTHFFFKFLVKYSKTTSETKALRKARIQFFKGEFKVSRLLGFFEKKLIEEALEYSAEQCVFHAGKRCRVDDNLSTCCVCLEEKASYYLFHGSTAHKCVCAKCAMNIAIKDNPACPICRQSVELIADSDPVVEKCICTSSDCSSVILKTISSSEVKLFPESMSLIECCTCTVNEKIKESEGLNTVYTLYK